MHKKFVTVADLSNNPEGELLHCDRCGADYSAHKGDYFMYPDNYVCRCSCVGRPYLRLAKRIVNYPDARVLS